MISPLAGVDYCVTLLCDSLFAAGAWLFLFVIGLSAGYENVQEMLGHLGGDDDEDDDEEEEEEGDDEESSAGAVSVEGSIDDEDDDSADGRKQKGDKTRGQVRLPSDSTHSHTFLNLVAHHIKEL